MTKSVAPSLDELLMSEDPAWLWDGERSKIVWANGAGTAWFGADTLFDLLDLVFDPQEEAVQTIRKLSQTLPRGDSAKVTFEFANATKAGKTECSCHVHALADGRSGLLVCSLGNDTSIAALTPALQATALSAIPLPICVVSGSNRVIYANDAIKTIFSSPDKMDFAEDLIAASLKSGTVSAVKKVETSHGPRDIRIIARCLEASDRLADANFLLVLEDITERRSLERTLMDAATGEIEADKQEEPVAVAPAKSSEPAPARPPENRQNPQAPAQEPVKPQNKAQPQTTASQPEKEVKTSQQTFGSNVVPDVVSSTLNKLPQPLVLIDQQGTLLFANDTTVQLMAVRSWQELGQVTTLAESLAALEGEDGNISVFTADDEPLSLDVIISTFPWKNGPVWQATLSPGDDGEGADNRRTPGSKKKTLK